MCYTLVKFGMRERGSTMVTFSFSRDVNLQDEFKQWMATAKKKNGETYSKATINSYCAALRRDTTKLSIDRGDWNGNIFFCDELDKFCELNALILADDNFDVVNNGSGHKAFGASLQKYMQFLTLRSGGSLEDRDTTTALPPKRYWVYAPGKSASKWYEFYAAGIMAIGWDELGSLELYDSREDMKDMMKSTYGADSNYRNDSLALWQFANEMRVGDVVYVKNGVMEFLGRGVVTGGYEFDENRDEFQHVRQVNWTHKESHTAPQKLHIKTLTDITQQTGHVESLEMLFLDPEDVVVGDDNVSYPPYTKEDFLKKVYMTEENYDTIKSLLLRKKNLILQGAPGVGKTFAAKRLAYAIMGEEDSSRVEMVQFHQSYSYEDFIMGYRPSETGFSLEKGVFYNFCKKAQDDEERDYFFIIDEINRGNLSKIFGELFMLIEADKRGLAHGMRLLYADELFSIPANLHIIGMMNTADRSLAMLDYALRRRFAFFDMAPVFDNPSFVAYGAKVENKAFHQLIKVICDINEEISKDESLGDGFRIGHSYLCLDTEKFEPNKIIDDAWVRGIALFEIGPLVEEYWFDNGEVRDKWVQALQGIAYGQ